MNGRSLILGGTDGLGESLARESVKRGFPPIIVGRSAREAEIRWDPKDQALFCVGDITNPEQLLDNLFRLPTLDDLKYIFLVAGTLIQKPLTLCTNDEIRQMYDLHLTGPSVVLAALHRILKMARPLADEPGQPYHLVTIASTSSWRVRDDQVLYTAAKAGQAHFMRNFARELVRDLPGSRATVVNPGGMKSGFFRGTNTDTSRFMDPREVALIIWDQVIAQTLPFREIHIVRTEDGKPKLEFGSRAPEMPF